MKADFHLHSYCSDGKYSPAEVVRRAAEAGVRALSLTDHDGMCGCTEAAREAEKLGLAFVPGWEISAYERDCKVHVLGYGCRENGAYRAFLKERVEGALARARTMVRMGNEVFGSDVSMEDVEENHTDRSAPIHLMHILRAFSRKLGRPAMELFVEAFVRGKPAYASEGRPTPQNAIDAIHAAGGRAVLAHPGRILLFSEEEERAYYAGTDREALKARSDERRAELIEGLIAGGLDGIECRYTTHTADETEYFLALAERNGLFATGGSDFHAEGGRARLGEPPFEADERLIGLLSEGNE